MLTPGHASPGIEAAVTEFADQIQTLGVTVQVFEPNQRYDAWGYYDHKSRTVWLRARLGGLQARSTLAHELAHAKHGHPGQHDEWEREAETTAAEQLVTVETLQATAEGLNLSGALAVALGVLPRDIVRFIGENREQATAAIMEALTHPKGLSIPRPNAYRQEHQPIVWDGLEQAKQLRADNALSNA